MNNYTIVDNNLYNDYDYLYEVLDATLEHEKVTNAIFSVVFVEDEEIHKMNKEYRGVDRITDVISFALEDNKDIEYDGIRVLGDIFICIPQMKRQAAEWKARRRRSAANRSERPKMQESSQPAHRGQTRLRQVLP